MPKCTICGENESEFFIKGTKEGYCKECAEDKFSDLDLLVTAEEQAKSLKEGLEEEGIIN